MIGGRCINNKFPLIFSFCASVNTQLFLFCDKTRFWFEIISRNDSHPPSNMIYFVCFSFHSVVTAYGKIYGSDSLRKIKIIKKIAPVVKMCSERYCLASVWEPFRGRIDRAEQKCLVLWFRRFFSSSSSSDLAIDISYTWAFLEVYEIFV